MVKLWPNMIKLFDIWNILAKSKCPDSKSFHNVKNGIDDPLTVAKHCFFSFLTGLLQPFLAAFHQGDGLMLPYLCCSIKELVPLLGLIVRPKVIIGGSNFSISETCTKWEESCWNKECPSWVCSWKWVTKSFKMWKGKLGENYHIKYLKNLKHFTCFV